MDNITLIAAIASITTLVVQIFDLFPRLGYMRGYLLAASAGFLVGSFTRAFEPASLTFNIEFTFGTIVLSILILLAIGFLLAGAFALGSREDFWGVAFVLLLVFTFGSIHVFSPLLQEDPLTIRELNYLAERAVENGDIDRALAHLGEIEVRVRTDEELHPIILERIQALRLQEIQ